MLHSNLLILFLLYISLSLLLVVDLPLYFPRDQPTLTFQSVYHFTNSGQLYSQVQKSYPYSPRWDGNEMAKRAKWVDLKSHLKHEHKWKLEWNTGCEAHWNSFWLIYRAEYHMWAALDMSYNNTMLSGLHYTKAVWYSQILFHLQ